MPIKFISQLIVALLLIHTVYAADPTVLQDHAVEDPGYDAIIGSAIEYSEQIEAADRENEFSGPAVATGPEIAYPEPVTMTGLQIEYSAEVMESRMLLLQSEGRTIPGAKDPFVAGMLSFFMLGVGQIYAKEYTKGSIFIAAGLLDKLALILLVSHINDKYAPSGDELVNLDWQSFDNSTRFLVVSYIVASLGLRVFCVADAVSSAKKFNQRYFSSNRQGPSNPGGTAGNLDPSDGGGTARLTYEDERFILYYDFSFSD